MANTFTADYTLPARAEPAATLLAADVATLLDCLNLAAAWVGTGPLAQQSWLADEVEVEEEAIRDDCATWTVLPPSDQHVAARVWVRAVGRGGAAFFSVVAGDDVAITFGDPDADDGTDWHLVGDLDIAPNGELITMGVAGGVSPGDGPGAVVQVCIELLALDSPLPEAVQAAEDIADITPFDPSTIVTDSALPSGLGHRIADAVGALLARGTTRYLWSALSTEFPANLRAMGPLGHAAYIPAEQYALAVDMTAAAVVGDVQVDVAVGARRLRLLDGASSSEDLPHVPETTLDTGRDVLLSAINPSAALTAFHLATTSPDAAPPVRASDTRWGRAVRAESFQAWSAALATLLGVRMRRSGLHALDYDGVDETTSPLGVDQTIRTLHTPSPRTTALWVGVRYQAAFASSPTHTLAIKLREMDGDSIDEGVEFTSEDLTAAADALDGAATDTYPPRFVHTGFRADPAAGSSATGARLINCDGYAGQTVELVTTTTDARVIDVVVWDIPVED